MDPMIRLVFLAISMECALACASIILIAQAISLIIYVGDRFSQTVQLLLFSSLFGLLILGFTQLSWDGDKRQLEKETIDNVQDEAEIRENPF